MTLCCHYWLCDLAIVATSQLKPLRSCPDLACTAMFLPSNSLVWLALPHKCTNTAPWTGKQPQLTSTAQTSLDPSLSLVPYLVTWIALRQSWIYTQKPLSPLAPDPHSSLVSTHHSCPQPRLRKGHSDSVLVWVHDIICAQTKTGNSNSPQPV